MYFDFATYARMVRLAFKEKNPAGRRRLFLVLFVVLPVVSSLTAICFFLDRILFPGLRRIQVREPVFCVGHARSGTTFLHRILSRDSERFSCFLLYEMFFPSLLEKKIIRFIAACDRNFLGARIEKRLRAWEQRKFAATQEIHAMGLTVPEEDDFVHTLSCASGFWIVLLPYMGKLDFYFVDERPAASRRRLMKFYKECIKRQLYLNGPDKIHLSKNPIFTGRIESLIETFPDARFVVLERNPFETIPSLLKLMKTSWSLRGWSDEEMRRSLQVLADQSVHTYTYPLEVLARHPETARAIVDYRELVAHPKRVVEDLYQQFGYRMPAEFEAVLAEEQRRAKAHRTGHTYSLEEFGLSDAEIRRDLAGLFDRFGWDDAAPARAERKGG